MGEIPELRRFLGVMLIAREACLRRDRRWAGLSASFPKATAMVRREAFDDEMEAGGTPVPRRSTRHSSTSSRSSEKTAPPGRFHL